MVVMTDSKHSTATQLELPLWQAGPQMPSENTTVQLDGVPNAMAGVIYVLDPETGWSARLSAATPVSDSEKSPLDPKGFTQSRKLQPLNVVPAASLIGEAEAMHYGAYDAPNKLEGGTGYGPFNWRLYGRKLDLMTYLNAALRHILSYTDGEENDQDSGIHHIKHAKATLGIVLDILARGNFIDNRPPAGNGPELLRTFTNGKA